jgi:hypothetical protein
MSRKQPDYAILVVWMNGEMEYVCEGATSDETARFRDKWAAKRQADFMKMGMEDETQSISVVRFPEPKKPRRIARRQGAAK